MSAAVVAWWPSQRTTCARIGRTARCGHRDCQHECDALSPLLAQRVGELELESWEARGVPWDQLELLGTDALRRRLAATEEATRDAAAILDASARYHGSSGA